MLNFVVQTRWNDARAHTHTHTCILCSKNAWNHLRYFWKFTFRSEMGEKWEISIALTDFRKIMMMHEQIVAHLRLSKAVQTIDRKLKVNKGTHERTVLRSQNQ